MWISLSEVSPNGDVVMQGAENISSSFSPEALHFLYPGNTMPLPTCCPILLYEKKWKLTSPQLFLGWTVLSLLKNLQEGCAVYSTRTKYRRQETGQMALSNLWSLPHSSYTLRNWLKDQTPALNQLTACVSHQISASIILKSWKTP